MSFVYRFRKLILGAMIGATLSMIAVSANLLWPQFQVFSLIRQLSSPDCNDRRIAAEELGKLGSVAIEAVPALEMALKDDSPMVREAAAFALCYIEPNSDVAAPVLLDSLEYCEPFTGGGCFGPSGYQLVARALKSMGHGCLPHLTSALTDNRRLVRYWACYCFGELGEDTEDRDKPLLDALNDEDNLVRIGAATAFWKIRHETELVLPVLRDVFGDRDRLVQLGKWSLLQYLEIEALPVLLDALHDADAWTRVGAADYIGRLDKLARIASPALIVASRNEDSGVREAALVALRCIHADPSLSLPALISALDDEIDSVRECAARGLAELGPDAVPAIDALTRASSDRAHRVRQAALEAVEQIKFSQTEEGMREARLLSKKVAF